VIILVQDRYSNFHLSDYTPYTGHKYTLCNRIYHTKDIINTLALDNAFPGICRTCHDTYESMYFDDLNYDPRMAHNSLHINLVNTYFHVTSKMAGPEIKYWDMTHKNWGTLRKLQRKVATRK